MRVARPSRRLGRGPYHRLCHSVGAIQASHNAMKKVLQIPMGMGMLLAPLLRCHAATVVRHWERCLLPTLGGPHLGVQATAR